MGRIQGLNEVQEPGTSSFISALLSTPYSVQIIKLILIEIINHYIRKSILSGVGGLKR